MKKKKRRRKKRWANLDFSIRHELSTGLVLSRSGERLLFAGEMSHDLIDWSILSLGYLEENDEDRNGNDNNEHQKDIGREELGKVGKRESETQVSHPVGEHADGERGWSRVLSETFGHVQEWDWSQAYCETHYEHDYAYDAQVREDDVLWCLLVIKINSTLI